MNKRKKGSEKEQLAGKLLGIEGYEILEFNFRCKLGEIDIVAKEGDTIVFVEVKYRSTEKMGLPEEAVTPRKQMKIIQVARFYILTHGLQNQPCRFDVVSILGNRYKIIREAFAIS